MITEWSLYLQLVGGSLYTQQTGNVHHYFGCAPKSSLETVEFDHDVTGLSTPKNKLELTKAIFGLDHVRCYSGQGVINGNNTHTSPAVPDD